MSNPSETDCTCPGDPSASAALWDANCPIHGHVVEPGSPEADARSCLIANLDELTYAEAVISARLPELDYDESCVDFLDRCSRWLIEYGKLLATVHTTHAEMAAELHQLRDERAAVRSFFGTTQPPGDS